MIAWLLVLMILNLWGAIYLAAHAITQFNTYSREDWSYFAAYLLVLLAHAGTFAALSFA